MKNREEGSVCLLCQEGTPKTSLRRAAATTQRHRDHFQVETITSKSSSAVSSCLDATHCVTKAMGSATKCSSSLEQHHLSQRCAASLQSESGGGGLLSRTLREQSAQSDWLTLIEAGTGTWTVLFNRLTLSVACKKTWLNNENCAGDSVMDP